MYMYPLCLKECKLYLFGLVIQSALVFLLIPSTINVFEYNCDIITHYVKINVCICINEYVIHNIFYSKYPIENNLMEMSYRFLKNFVGNIA